MRYFQSVFLKNLHAILLILCLLSFTHARAFELWEPIDTAKRPFSSPASTLSWTRSTPRPHYSPCASRHSLLRLTSWRMWESVCSVRILTCFLTGKRNEHTIKKQNYQKILLFYSNRSTNNQVRPQTPPLYLVSETQRDEKPMRHNINVDFCATFSWRYWTFTGPTSPFQERLSSPTEDKVPVVIEDDVEMTKLPESFIDDWDMNCYQYIVPENKIFQCYYIGRRRWINQFSILCV